MNDLYFYGSKIAWLVLSPVNLIFCLLAFGVVLLWMNKLTWGKRIVTFVTALILCLGVLPVDQWLIRPLENAYPQPDLTTYDKIDGLIILGGEFNTRISADRDNVTSLSGTERINAFIKLMRLYPQAKAVFTGGSGLLSKGMAESTLSHRYMHDLGVDTSSIVFEDKARNTRENAIYTKEIMQPQAGENWVLITSAFHMKRSVREFNKQGLDVIPYPVAFRTSKETHYAAGNIRLSINNLITATREWLALLRP